MDKKEKYVKCPICGRFASKKPVQIYLDKISAMEKDIIEKQAKIDNMREWMNAKNERIEELQKKLHDAETRLNNAEDTIQELRSRNIWDRIINK